MNEKAPIASFRNRGFWVRFALVLLVCSIAVGNFALFTKRIQFVIPPPKPQNNPQPVKPQTSPPVEFNAKSVPEEVFSESEKIVPTVELTPEGIVIFRGNSSPLFQLTCLNACTVGEKVDAVVFGGVGELDYAYKINNITFLFAVAVSTREKSKSSYISYRTSGANPLNVGGSTQMNCREELVDAFIPTGLLFCEGSGGPVMYGLMQSEKYLIFLQSAPLTQTKAAWKESILSLLSTMEPVK